MQEVLFTGDQIFLLILGFTIMLAFIIFFAIFAILQNDSTKELGMGSYSIINYFLIVNYFLPRQESKYHSLDVIHGKRPKFLKNAMEFMCIQAPMEAITLK